jgi:hypothetical protein
MGKLAAWAEVGADDAMLARREKAIFGLKEGEGRSTGAPDRGAMQRHAVRPQPRLSLIELLPWSMEGVTRCFVYA